MVGDERAHTEERCHDRVAIGHEPDREATCVVKREQSQREHAVRPWVQASEEPTQRYQQGGEPQQGVHVHEHGLVRPQPVVEVMRRGGNGAPEGDLRILGRPPRKHARLHSGGAMLRVAAEENEERQLRIVGSRKTGVRAHA